MDIPITCVQAIFDRGALGIAEIGLDGSWLVVNSRFCQMLGYSEAELQVKTLQEVTHPDDMEESLAGQGKLVTGEVSWDAMENRYIRKDGTVFRARLHRSLVRDHDNVPRALIAIVEDLTEKIQTERALQDSERRLTLAQQAAHLGVWDRDLRTNQIVSFGEYAGLYGLASDHPPVTYEEWLRLVHPDDRERVQGVVMEALERHHDWDVEFRVCWPNGSMHWLCCKGAVYFDESGQPMRTVGINFDITERKRAEEQRSHLAAIVESSDIAIIGETVEGVIVSWNKGAEKLYGYKAEEVVGRHISLLIPPEGQDRIAPVLERLRSGERIEHFETTRKRKDETLVQVALTLSPIRDSTAAVVGISAIACDITEQKQAEGKLRESEERFRNMADTAPVMIWVTGPDKRAAFFNKSCLDFTGHTLEEKLGDGWIAALHNEDRERFLGVYYSSIDARQEFCAVSRLRRADGEYRWVLCTGVPRFAPAGIFAGYIGSCIDITDQKLIEERLRASEAQLMDAQRLAKVGSWERHIDTDSICWSDEVSRILGVSKPPSNFPSFLQCVHPKDREKILEADRNVCTTYAPVDTEYRIIRPDGEVRFVRSIVEAVRNDQGVAVRLAGATQDVTEQVKARELLRESEERLKNAERLAHLGHWHWDLKSNQVIWSEECFRLFGQPPDYKPSYEGVLQMIVPQDRERIERGERHNLAEKSGSSIEFRIVRPDGDLRTVTAVFEVLLDEEGQPASVFGACQDVTDVRRAQQESVARQKLESVGTLASGIAHDFNNLLGSVLAQAELGLGELAAGSNPETQLKAIRDVALRGSEIVRELMIYAGKESGVVGLVDVSQTVEEMLELLKVSVSKHAVLEADLAKDLPAVRANAAQLRQIVMNLVTNASDAIGDRDGVIRVTTRCVKLGRDFGVVSDRLADGDYLQLEVSDTGRGIPPETQPKVFDPFFTTKSAGHGLGLSIVHGIVRGLGGAIHLTSELGKGATFQIFLPCAQTMAGATRSLRSDTDELAHSCQDATVLVVEDEGALRQAVATMLRKTGFEVFEAADGSAAIDLLRAKGG